MIDPFRQNAFQAKCLRLLLSHSFAIIALLGVSINVLGDTGGLRNRRPKITGQKDLTINQGQSITIELSDLYVEDPDNWFYPLGFTLKVHPGHDYTLKEYTVTPNSSFTGVLHVPVQVNDGRDDSENYDLLITVIASKTAPAITGQQPISVNEDQTTNIALSQLTIEGADASKLNLTLAPGNHYTVQNTTVIPEANFSGALSVPVFVSDGETSSNTYNVTITVVEVNDPPIITTQQAIVSNEDTPIALSPSQIAITDPDDAAFTLTISPGDHYAVNNTTVTPESNYNGSLSIPISANDGESSSNTFNLIVTVNSVNDVPKIVGQQPISTDAAGPVNVALADLQVDDPDNSFPQDFTLSLLPGENYSVAENTVTPAPGFFGTLPVMAKVSDGLASSDPFSLSIEVRKGNVAPIITNQTPVIINEDESFDIGFSDLQVIDPDDPYPRGFSLNLGTGDHYRVTDKTVIPDQNFSGNIFVPVTVSDGRKSSEPFNFQISITPVNDAPEIETLNNDTLVVRPGSEPYTILDDITISDVDNETLALAEVSIDSTHYDAETDKLIFSNTSNIKGVFDSKSGVLALIGKAAIDEYADALKTVKLQMTGQSSSIRKRVIFRVNDGVSNSNKIHRSVRIEEENYSFNIPSGFTPNGDQINDTWSILTEGDEAAKPGKIRVYTKSGLLVFEADDLSMVWDGRYNGILLPPDVYFYTVKFDTTDNTSQVPVLKGIVTILR